MTPGTLFALSASPPQIIGLYMTEAGIIFHSLMIGVTLGVTGGDAFATLLLALSLHQVRGLGPGPAAGGARMHC